MPEATEVQYAQRVEFGARVRELRLAETVSHQELAHRAGLDRSYVGQVERGERNVSLNNMHRLATAIGCKALDLLS